MIGGSRPAVAAVQCLDKSWLWLPCSELSSGAVCTCLWHICEEEDEACSWLSCWSQGKWSHL